MAKKRGALRRRRRWRRSRGHGGNPDHYSLDDTPLTGGGGGAHGIFQVGNATLDDGLVRWLDARHAKLRCTPKTPVYFAPFSPNGIGNKIMAMVMAFHIALMDGRALIVSDWPPTTLDTSYKVEDFLQPSGCQALFDSDTHRPKVTKCTVAGCPTRTASRFTDAHTQPHWAHQSMQFLEVPRAWAHLDWLAWWRALTQYLLQPGPRLLHGLGQTLRRATLLHSPGSGAASASSSSSATAAWLQLAGGGGEGDDAAARAAAQLTGFGARFAAGVAHWGGPSLKRPLVGVHVRLGGPNPNPDPNPNPSPNPNPDPMTLTKVRLGDGCGDLKRGGCKYVRSFASAVTRLREAGVSSGTLLPLPPPLPLPLASTPTLPLTLPLTRHALRRHRRASDRCGGDGGAARGLRRADAAGGSRRRVAQPHAGREAARGGRAPTPAAARPRPPLAGTCCQYTHQ